MDKTIKRGVATVGDLRARSIIDPNTHCWLWQGASIKGQPRIWTLHIDDVDKKVLSGPRAVWYIAHGTPLRRDIAYMACWTRGCVCPVHVRRCAGQAELNRIAGRAGVFGRSGAALAANLVNAAKARAAAGICDTPPDVVLAVRAAIGGATQVEIGRRFGISKTVVSRIARGQTHRHVLGEPAQKEEAAACAR